MRPYTHTQTPQGTRPRTDTQHWAEGARKSRQHFFTTTADAINGKWGSVHSQRIPCNLLSLLNWLEIELNTKKKHSNYLRREVQVL